MGNRVIVFLILFSVTLSVSAQEKQVVLKTYVKDGKTYLRWAPSDIAIFEAGLKQGYTIEKVSGTNTAGFDQAVKKSIFIQAPYAKLDSLAAQKKQSQEYLLIDAFRRKQADEKIKKQAFGYILISAGYNPAVARAAGLHYAEAAETCMYRVRINGTAYASSIVVNNLQPAAPKPIVLEKPEATKKTAVLHWEAASLNGDYSAYFIERSEDNKTFKKLTATPLVFFKSQYEKDKTHFYHEDTTCERGKLYYYRVSGVNHFALESFTSNVQEIYIRKAFEPVVIIDTLIRSKNARLIRGKITYTESSQGKNARAIIVQVSKDPVNHFKTVSDEPVKDAFSFEITDTVNRNRIHYRVGVISVDHDTAFSYPHYFFFNDADPPVLPSEVKGTIDTAGIVHLDWKANTEKDLKGYKVFRCNSLNEEFVEVTRLLAPAASFTDTVALNNLDSLTYYRVVAVDSSFNHSEPSQPVKLRKPDKVAPVAALVAGLRTTKKGLLLAWKNSTSTDVRNTKLLRMENGAAVTLKIFAAGDTTSFYMDTLTKPGNIYQYKLETRDYSGNLSASVSPRQVFEPGYRKALAKVEAKADIHKKQISLTWERPAEKVYRYHIYRAKNDGSFILLKTIDAANHYYNDTDLSINNVYHYKLKAVYQNGVHSEMSVPVKVSY